MPVAAVGQWNDNTTPEVIPVIPENGRSGAIRETVETAVRIANMLAHPVNTV
jgi:hypothetical protein